MTHAWGDERYVRLFTRDTPSWVLGPWEARAVLGPVMRKLDRAGIIDLGDDGLEGLAVLAMLPLEVVEPGMAWWIKRGTFELVQGRLVMPNFLEAQEATATDAKRSREKRERARDLARAESVRGRPTDGDTKRVGVDTTPPEPPPEGGSEAPSSGVGTDTARVALDTKRDELTRNVSEVTRGDTPYRTVPSVPGRADRAVPAVPPAPDPSLRSGERGKAPKGTRIPEDFAPTPATTEWASKQGEGVDASACVEEFADYWRSVPGAKGLKADWQATFKNQIRRLIEQGRAPRLSEPPPPPPRPVNPAKAGAVTALLAGIGAGGGIAHGAP